MKTVNHHKIKSIETTGGGVANSRTLEEQGR